MAYDNDSFNKFFNPEFIKGFPMMTGTTFDMGALLESQRKNLQAFTEAQQLAVEGLQAVAQRQAEILSGMVESNTNIAQEIMSESSPEQKVARQAELMKDAYESTVSTIRELTDMLSQSNMEAADIINKRVSASLNEMKGSMQKKTSSSSPAAKSTKKAA